MDYQYQLTQIYNKLNTINSNLVKLSLMSNVNTIQVGLSSKLNDLSGDLSTLTGEVEELKLIISDLLARLISLTEE